MEVNQQRAEAAKACFDFNKNLNTVNVTSDLECFGDRNAAVNHARGLEDSSIDVFDREIDGIEWNEDESDDFTDEAFDIPDYDLAKAKAEGSGSEEEFEQNAPPAAPEPVVEQTPVIEQPSAMDNLVKDPEQVTQTGVVAESGQAATQDLQAVETASAVTPVIAEPGQPAVLAVPVVSGTSEVTPVIAEPGKPAVLAEPVVLTPTQKRLNTLAAKKAAAAEKAQEGK
ncbi:hypothetical protein [Mucilaginibacter sp.]|uniref:hypothetical protein n=1 Tax=Mucilaginibacter sp. TaxID=1882438 RepID=UPI000CB835DC|nr:hypothetical protein [Mucilaginibacter sp.]PLW89988.1 MAG: hypothetical protein C0154_08675 [Mucilaginibacter sp.]PMP65782.1 MAG: hypothetical protein C0191_02665 [Mucilaginibacter sp.]